ncbi:MAG TPA: MoaD/ThiS family protein [Bacillota bacterium]|jgi:molybdopterin converting factor small subunit
MSQQVKVTLKYYNLVRETTHQVSESLAVEAGSTWMEVIEGLCRRYGPQFGLLVMPQPGRLNPQLRVFSDGHILLDDRLKEPVTEGAELSFFSAISGG